MKTALDVLQQTRNLLADEANWTQGEWARTADGKSTVFGDPNACSFCLSGALNRQRNDPEVSLGAMDYARFIVEDEIGSSHHEVSIVSFNDRESTTHADVLKVLDAAIAACKKGA